MKKIKKVLVTGHRGFIGKNMTETLCFRGIEPFGLEKDTKYSSDVLSDMDAVIHLGAVSSTTETDWGELRSNNIVFSKRLILDCVERNIPIHYASSASVYGDAHDTNEDDFNLKPKNKYALSKYILDKWVMENKFPNVLGFRYFNVYGRHEEHKKEQASPVSKFSWQAKDTGEIFLFENSEQYIRDFVNVRDVCYIHLGFLLLDQGHSGIFNIGTGKPISFAEVARLVANKYNAKITEIPMPESIKLGYQPYTKANLNKLNTVYPDYNFLSVSHWLKYYI